MCSTVSPCAIMETNLKRTVRDRLASRLACSPLDNNSQQLILNDNKCLNSFLYCVVSWLLNVLYI